MKTLLFSESWYYFLIGAAVSYLIGCFNFAVLISKIKKRDIRGVGSGNPGTMNMSRTFGLKIGVINFLCDAFKGALPVLCGYLIFKDYVFAGTLVPVSDFARYLFGLCAVVGHVFPVTMKFKGGKGIASTLGLFWCALSCEEWWFCFVCLGILVCVLFYIVFTEWGSMGSLIGVSVFSVWQLLLFVLDKDFMADVSSGYAVAVLMMLLAVNLLTWTAHRKNLCDLLAGEEHRTSVKKMIKKKKTAKA